ncbi:FAD-dependent monooxygenase [Balneatrix alpica]|uniref:FAD-dependent monooxygenase n=1 Tax=Balneatrix alpica TaxID=75684 RepID=A0ABV5Z786_9GAMM|nr:FAD-dependent monooxygenase [Balneatrix alpica]
MDTQFDIIIVGGGMVGAALACALADGPWRVLLLEQHALPQFSAEQPHDLRVSAVSLASEALLSNLGVWPQVLAMRACPFRRMRVWEKADGAGTLFSSQELGLDHLGHIVENKILQEALWQRLQALPQVTCLAEASITKVQYRAEGSQVWLQDGQCFSARLLVGADGLHSQVRQAAGIGISGWDYDMQALVAYVRTAYTQQDITWQRFTPNGPQAFLPLSGPYASLVWYERPERVKALLGLDHQELLQAFQHHFPVELGEVVSLEAKTAFPLRRQHALDYAKAGVVLVGDAAHGIHPLAGQGVNLGFMDVAVLAELLLAEPQALGSAKLGQTFEQKRRRANLAMMTLMDMFYRVFSNDVLPLKHLRALALQVADKTGPLKQQAMKYALGLNADLPALARFS